MKSKDSFAEWLKLHTNIATYTVGRYTGAIDTVSSETEKYGLKKLDLYTLNDPGFIDEILDNPSFQRKNNKGNRMYSAALIKFKTYLEYNLAKDFQAELLQEELEFERYLVKSPNQLHSSSIEDMPQDKPLHKTVNNRNIWRRNPKYASEAISNADYLCEVNNNHKHFISKFSQEYYVEAHHLIPMKYQDHFNWSLDVHANIVSICIVCHKQIHLGLFEERKKILAKIFKSRRDRLIKCGINVQLDQLFSYYQD